MEKKQKKSGKENKNIANPKNIINAKKEGRKSSLEKHKRRRITRAIENINIAEAAKKIEKLPQTSLNEPPLGKNSLSAPSLKNEIQSKGLDVKESGRLIEEIVQRPARANGRKTNVNPFLEAQPVENLEQDVDEGRKKRENETAKKDQQIYGIPAEGTYEPVKYTSLSSPDYETAARNQKDLYVPKPRTNIVSPGREDFVMRAIREPTMGLRGQVRAVVDRSLRDTEVWKSPATPENWESPDNKKYYVEFKRKEEKKRW